MRSSRCPAPGRVVSILSALLALLALIGNARSADAIQLQSWVAGAQIVSGNTTLTESPAPPSPSGPDVSTGFLEANGSNLTPPPAIDAGAAAVYGLSMGMLGVTAGFDAESNFPIDNRIFRPGAGASVSYFDDLTVTSSTLAVGTPVTVRFVFDLGFTEGASSTLDEATSSAQVSSVAAGFQGLAAGDNRIFDALDTGTFIQNGLFVAPHHAEYTISSTVGATFSFNVAMASSSGGLVRFTGTVGNEVNHFSNGWSGVGLSFGGEVVGADAALVSGLLTGPFPSASAVSPANAEAAVPPNPFEVPEPGSTTMLLIGSLGLTALARRSSSRDVAAGVDRARRRA